MFAKLGRWCFRNRGKVVLLWLAVLIVSGGVSSMLGTAYSTEFALPDVESRRGFDILDEHFAGSGAGGEGGTIVFRARPWRSVSSTVASFVGVYDANSTWWKREP